MDGLGVGGRRDEFGAGVEDGTRVTQRQVVAKIDVVAQGGCR